ncbi:hypothetical protein PCASD_25465, partial [Puccinia coronata f. sp. avenae]
KRMMKMEKAEEGSQMREINQEACQPVAGPPQRAVSPILNCTNPVESRKETLPDCEVKGGGC